MQLDANWHTVIPSRRLIFLLKFVVTDLRQGVSVKCTLYAGSEPHTTSNKIAVPIELQSAVRGKYLSEIQLLMATEAIYSGQQQGESTYLKCHYY